MKARNNFNSYLNTGSEDNQVNNDDFTPVRNKRNKTAQDTSMISTSTPPNAPQKASEKASEKVTENVYDKSMDEYLNVTPTNLTFDSTPLKETIPVISDAPKKSRRNLDALGESIPQPRFDDTNNNTNNTNTRTYNNVSRRDMSGLEEEILRSQNKSTTNEGDSQNGRNGRYDQNGRNGRNGYQNRRQVYQPEPQPEKEKEQVLPSMNDSELFPTLGFSKSTEQKKISVWSVFNPNLMVSKEKEVIKTNPSEKQKNTSTNNGTNPSTNDVTFYDVPNINGNNSEEEYSYTYNEEYDESYEDDPEEDSEQAYIRELYDTKYDLDSKLEFLKKTYNKNNRQHVIFKHQLEDELADIEHKIQLNDDLNTELDNIYAMSYYQEPSPYEKDKEKRKMEEYMKSEANRTSDFFKMLASVK